MESIGVMQARQQSLPCQVSDTDGHDNKEAAFGNRGVTSLAVEKSELPEFPVDDSQVFKKKVLKEYKVSKVKKATLYMSHILSTALGGAIIGSVMVAFAAGIIGAGASGLNPVVTGIVAGSGAVVGAIGGGAFSGFMGYAIADIKVTQRQLSKYKAGIDANNKLINDTRWELRKIDIYENNIREADADTDTDTDTGRFHTIDSEKSARKYALKQKIALLQKKNSILNEAREELKKELSSYMPDE